MVSDHCLTIGLNLHCFLSCLPRFFLVLFLVLSIALLTSARGISSTKEKSFLPVKAFNEELSQYFYLRSYPVILPGSYSILTLFLFGFYSPFTRFLALIRSRLSVLQTGPYLALSFAAFSLVHSHSFTENAR